MGLDIITQRNCEVKEQIPQELLIKQVLERHRGFAVFNMILKSGKSQEEALDSTFTFSSQTPDGVKNVELKVRDLLERTAPHDKSMLDFYNYFNHLFLALMHNHDVLMD